MPEMSDTSKGEATPGFESICFTTSGTCDGSALTRRPTSPSMRVASRCSATRLRRTTPTAATAITPASVKADRQPCVRAAWRIIFRWGPVQSSFLVRSADAGPFHDRRQKSILGLCVPECCPFRQPQFGPASPCFALLASQPVAQ